MWWPLAALVAVVGALGLAYGIHQWRQRHVAAVSDSPEFSTALTLWYRPIGMATDTPRALKRFLNRMRYIAMRERVERGEPLRQAQLDLAEPALVALSTVEAVEPSLLDDAQALAQLTEEAPPDLPAPLGTSLVESSRSHRDNFGQWPPDAEQVRRYRELLAGVRLN